MSAKARVFWPLLFLVPLADCSTKELAVEHLGVEHVPHGVLGSVVRFTLAYNPGMAFSIDIRPYVGEWARPLFILTAVVIVAILARVYRRARPSARLIAVALALVAGGAIGNAMDRFRARPGVVDFIDVGVGSHRFGIFNLADAGITIGAVLLAFILLREDRASRLTELKSRP